MFDYPEAYTADLLADIIESNDSAPTIAADEIDRIIDVAQRRADERGGPLEDDQVDCLIATDWHSFAAGEFGYDGEEPNQFAIGVLEKDVSAGKGATLFTETEVFNNSWLQTGDGRKAETHTYVDDDYEQADDGDLWIPNGAQEYIAIIVLDSELVHDSPEAADAM